MSNTTNPTAHFAASPALDRKRERYTGDPEVEWQEFWKAIVAPDGTLDVEQVKKELADFSMLLHHVPLVYEHATGGAVTYPNTTPAAVISAIDNHVQDLTEDARKDGAQDAARPTHAPDGEPLVYCGGGLSAGDAVFRARVADLIHLLQHATITTPSDGDVGQAKQAMEDIKRHLTAPQPAPATGDEREFTAWLVSEMPAGTIIGDPAWWAPRILRAMQGSTAQNEGARDASAQQDEREAAERAYSSPEFNYERGPIGSHDWRFFRAGWKARAAQQVQAASLVAVVREDHDGTKHAVLRDESLADGTLLVAASAVEDMIADCVPGGSICDPQVVADAIRAYFAAQRAPATGDERDAKPLTQFVTYLNEHCIGQTITEESLTEWMLDVMDNTPRDEPKHPQKSKGLFASAAATGDAREALSEFEHDLKSLAHIAVGEAWEEIMALARTLQVSAAHRREDQRDALGSILGQDEDGLPISRHSHRSFGMQSHPNGTWVRYAEVEMRIATMQRAAAPAHGEFDVSKVPGYVTPEEASETVAAHAKGGVPRDPCDCAACVKMRGGLYRDVPETKDERQAFEAAYVQHMNTQPIHFKLGMRDYTAEEIAARRMGLHYDTGRLYPDGYLNGCWWGWQAGQRAGGVDTALAMVKGDRDRLGRELELAREEIAELEPYRQEGEFYRFLRDGGADDCGDGPWSEAYAALGSVKPPQLIDAAVAAAIRRKLEEENGHA